MNRRTFLKGILAAGVAPYIATTAGVLMPVRKVWSSANPLFFGELGEYLDVIVRYTMPLSMNGISGDSLLIGNEEAISICQIATRVALNGAHRGDRIIVGKVPPGALIHSVQTSQGIVEAASDDVKIRLM